MQCRLRLKQHMAVLVQLSKCRMACSHPDDDKGPAILIKDKAHDGSCSQVIWAQWAGLRSSFCPEARIGRSAPWLAGSAEKQSCLGARLNFGYRRSSGPTALAVFFRLSFLLLDCYSARQSLQQAARTTAPSHPACPGIGEAMARVPTSRGALPSTAALHLRAR